MLTLGVENNQDFTLQMAITCSKLTIEEEKQCVKYAQS